MHSARGEDGRGVEGGLDPSLDLGSGEYPVAEPTSPPNDRGGPPELVRSYSEF